MGWWHDCGIVGLMGMKLPEAVAKVDHPYRFKEIPDGTYPGMLLIHPDDTIIGLINYKLKTVYVQKGNLPETPLEDFIKELLHPDEDHYRLPRKLTGAMGGHWGCNFNPYKEVFAALAIRSIKNDWSNVYEMPSGEVHVVYEAGDGYETATKVTSFDNMVKYMKSALGL